MCKDYLESPHSVHTAIEHQPRLGAAACARLWQDNVRLSQNENSEPIKTAFVDACFTIEKRMLRNNDIAKLIIDADLTMPNNPFNSVYKLEAIIKKAGTEANIRWCVSGCLDLVRSNAISSGELALRQLTGRGLPGNKGILDTLLGKLELGQHVAKTGITLQLDPSLLTRMNRWLDNGHHEYRKDLGEGNKDDISWVAALPPSSQSCLRLFEDIVFSTNYDYSIKSQKVAGAPLLEILEKSPPLFNTNGDRNRRISESRLESQDQSPGLLDESPENCTFESQLAQSNRVSESQN